jgi:hypothetical protein
MAHLKAETDAHRPPLLVLGSGLLAQTGYHSVSSWTGLLERLLETVAPNEAPIPRHLIGLSPTTTWELIVQRFARASKVRAAASGKPELAAQRALAALVRSGLQRDRSTTRDEIAPGIPVTSLLSSRLAGVVSLNFTPEPFATALQSARLGPKKERSRKVRGCEGLEVFFPHGDIESPASLALGLRKYAERVERWEDLRQLACEAERKASGRRSPLAIRERTTFIHHALASPIIFAGCGLREVESTLWWLLATRARNCAQSVPLTQPLAYYLTAEPLSLTVEIQLEFTRCKPLHFREHTDVWTFVSDLIDALPDWRHGIRAAPSDKKASGRKARGTTSNSPRNAATLSAKSLRTNHASTSTTLGRIRQGALWRAVQAAGLERSSHDLSLVPQDERGFALGVALRITDAAPNRRSADVRKGLPQRTDLPQLVVVHTKNDRTVVLREFWAPSLDELAVEAKSPRLDCLEVFVASKATSRVLRSNPQHRASEAIERRGLFLMDPSDVRRFLLEMSRRPTPEVEAAQALRLLILSDATDRESESYRARKLRNLLHELGWHDIAVQRVGAVPDPVWNEIVRRIGELERTGRAAELAGR